MLHHKRARNEQGMTLVELVVTMTITLMMGVAFYTFFKTNLLTYLNLQKDASAFTNLSNESHRIATVVRGLTDITDANNNDLTIYGYFYPTDTYVSLIRYYLNPTGTVLYADVTPMTANPPIGSLITNQKKTYTIVSSFKLATGVNLFTYLDSVGNPLTVPITDLHTIKGVRINLAVTTAAASSTNQAMYVDVSLRNRKTNL
ncbi:MAG TPA: prepilin-type N-terminal cleavage/methylation domain-containing protein [Candidatus Saccharimonadales bacterium]|nr:prepilin-type N-terminal cleavage/methylation domain-containing protein [Candidatus Saccharimonadales bacterium]